MQVAEQMVRGMIDTGTDAFIELDDRRQCHRLESEAEAMFGGRAEILGNNLRHFDHPPEDSASPTAADWPRS